MSKTAPSVRGTAPGGLALSPRRIAATCGSKREASQIAFKIETRRRSETDQSKRLAGPGMRGAYVRQRERVHHEPPSTHACAAEIITLDSKAGG